MRAILFLMILFPLLGGVFHALLGRRVPRRLVELVACGSVGASFLMSVAAVALGGRSSFTVTFWNWFSVGDLSVAMDAFYTPIAGLMTLMVTFVSGLIHVYSVWYMREDRDYARYFCYLNLFVFSMLVITLADNLVFLFLGWEGVGFCSYALIGFWYADIANAAAGKKAFLLTRIGDVAFVIAIGTFFTLFNSLSISAINAGADRLTGGLATLLAVLLLWSAMGKSAQLPLAVWLPDAMAGPTPVSALMHAATMVTAGVYLLIRLYPVVVLSPIVMTIIAAVGVITALWAASSALAQRDIKRVLAYSTISQLGYMFLGVGAGDITGSMAYLLSHAFFKSLLFMTAGCIIQALHEEHDIFRMGAAVRRRMPAVFVLFLIGALSLGAIPPSSGFVGKDRLLVAILARGDLYNNTIWFLAVLTSFLTTLYTFRLFFMVFTGGDPDRPVVSLPPMMVKILWPLAAASVIAAVYNLPPAMGGSEYLSVYLSALPGAYPDVNAPASLEWLTIVAETGAAGAGLLAAFAMYGPAGSMRGAEKPMHPGGIREFFFSGFYLDRLYHVLIVRPYTEIARILWVKIDEGGVDRALVGSAGSLEPVSIGLRFWSTGRLSTGLRMFLLGFAVMLCVFAASFYAG